MSVLTSLAEQVLQVLPTHIERKLQPICQHNLIRKTVKAKELKGQQTLET